MSFLIRLVVNGVALWVASLLLDGIHLGGDADTTTKVLTIGAVALIFGLVNAIIRPIMMVLAFPLLILTLGLFTFVVNALMLSLTSWLSDAVGLSFTVDRFFWDAILGALIITLVSMVLSMVLPDGKNR